VHFLACKLGQGCFGPISDELDGVEEVFFLGSQLLKAILFWQVLDQDMFRNCFALVIGPSVGSGKGFGTVKWNSSSVGLVKIREALDEIQMLAENRAAELKREHQKKKKIPVM
jgi:hypothetical protein